jgi:hypothetical protein
MASLFKLDSGERNDIYDFAAITFKKDAVKTFFNFAGLNELALRDSKTGIPLQISYTYFEHKNSNEKASGPIIKESYRYGDNSFMDINDIGVYTLNGVQHHKSALIDFRPIVVLVDPISSEIDPVNGNTELKFNFLPSTLSPISGSFYVGRVDNLYLDKSGRYVVVEGSPEINPVPPSKNVTNGMLLYKIFVPPLTPDIRRVSFERVENKRYTMRDIGKLEERIKNLEYYTSLSLLEKDVQSLMVKDADGNTREKNGFIVDTFSNHSVGNVFNNDYNIAVDPTEQAARHPFKTTRLDLELLEAKDFKETDYKQLANNFTLTTNEPTGLYIIKPEAIEPFIVQPVATTEESVTPFDVTVFDGKIYLSPEVDDWIDYKQLPAVKSNLPGERDNWEFMAQLLTNNNIAPFGTVYGEWRTTSVDKSSERTGRPQCDIDLLSTTVSDARITSGAGFDEWWSREQQRLGRLPDEGLVGADVNVRNTVIGTLNANRVWADVRTTQREYERDCVVAVKDTTTTNQIRDTKTLQAKVFEQENIVDLGSKVVDMAVSHYIRPQTISIYVVGLKPKTKFNVFFDGVSVNEFCRIYDPSNPSATISFNQGTVKTDEKGSARILFDVPSGKFRTGDRVIVITDNDTPNIEDFATKMYATKVFGASGLTVTKQSTELLVRTYDFVPGDTIRGTENRQLVDETTRIERDINRFFTVDRDVIPGPPRRTRDPLAQTFFVNEEEYPNGLYVDSVDLCFGTKDTVRPVYVELRPVVNGLPDAERIYPQATAVLPPEKINAVNDLNLLPSLSDSRSYTRFEFGTPIYLPPGQHSLVVRTDITSYTVFTAKLGENDLATGKKVQGQEYVGVFFRSANLSTWQPDGTTDLMFRMNKCVFDTDASPTNPITKTIDFTVDTDRDFNNTFEVDPNYLTYQLYNLALNYSNPNNVCEITFDIENVTKTNEQESNEVAANTDITLNRSFNLYKTDTITNRRFKMTINATIKDKHISPIFDIQKSGVCFVRNMIDETEIGLDGVVKTEMVTNELKPLADLKDSTLNGVQPATCRYITRSVILNKGFDATNCRLLITAVKPKGTDILAFIKMKSALSKERFEDSSYVQMNYVGSQFTSINNEDYREMEFEMPEDVTEFNEFQIKLCLFSNDSAVTPKIKNLRGIAII